MAPPKKETVQILPALPAENDEPMIFAVPLWCLPYQSKLFIRGSTNGKHVLENMSTFLLRGNQTATYPIEVVPIFTCLRAGVCVCPRQTVAGKQKSNDSIVTEWSKVTSAGRSPVDLATQW